MNLTTQYKEQTLYLTYIDMTGRYALATFDQTQTTKLFKVDITDLELTEDQLKTIDKHQLKQQF